MATQLKPGIECSKEEWQARLDLGRVLPDF